MKKLICLLLCLCMVLCACESGTQLRIPGNFYYYRSQTAYGGTDGVIAPEPRELSAIQEDLGAVLALYCQGPLNSELENPLPHGTCVEEYTLENGVLTLRFDPGFAALSGVELTVAAACITRTFLELTDAETIVLTAGGALLNGETAMTLTLADLALQDNSLDQLQEEFTVYYTDASRRWLIAQHVSLSPASQEEIPALLLGQLLTPPAGSGLRSALPAGTRIQSVTVENGLCTVDLNPEFESRRFYTHTGQLLTLMSVVNTLTALEGVSRVEFTIDGSLLIRYGALSISEPLVRDERFLGPVRTGLGESDATIYLAHGEEGGLLPIPTRLRQTSAVSEAEVIVRYLLSYTGLNGIATRIPEGTRLNSVTIDGGVCHVDLSGEYLDSPDDLLWAGRVIAASVCTLDDIFGVQITVDGGIPAEFDRSLFGTLTPIEDWFL